LNKRVIGIGLA
jgi:hypothetical protein